MEYRMSRAGWENSTTLLFLLALFLAWPTFGLSFLGFFGWIGHEFLTRAHGFAPASLLSPFSQVFIIYLGVWSFFIFDTLPDQWTVVGALIISAASMTIWLRERRLARALLAHPGAVRP